MITKTRIFILLFLALMALPLNAENLTVIGKVKSAQGDVILVREKTGGRTTLTVEVNQEELPVWTKTWSDSRDGDNLLDYWQIIDGYVQGEDVAFIVGMHRGLLWVKAIRASGLWNVTFSQELYGAASLGLKTTKIMLKGGNSVVVIDGKGVATTFTRNDAGEVFKDGVLFKNTPPYSTITKP